MEAGLGYRNPVINNLTIFHSKVDLIGFFQVFCFPFD